MIENNADSTVYIQFFDDRFYSTADFWSDQLYSGISASAFLDDALWFCHWSWNWIWCSVYRWCDREIYVCGFMVGAGVLLAVIAFVSYKIGIFILGAGIGIGLGIYVFHPTTSLVFFFCLLLGVGLGVLAMKQAREVLIIGTSLLGGAMAGFSAAKLGGLADIPYGLGLSAGFALLGMLIQLRQTGAKMMTRKKSTKRMRITMDRTVLIMWISGIICHRNQKERRRKKSEEHRHRDKM